MLLPSFDMSVGYISETRECEKRKEKKAQNLKIRIIFIHIEYDFDDVENQRKNSLGKMSSSYHHHHHQPTSD